MVQQHAHKSLAHPGFPGGGGVNLLFGIIFAENYMQMKKNGLRIPRAPPDPPMQMIKKNNRNSIENTEKLILNNLRYHRMLKKKNQNTFFE